MANDPIYRKIYTRMWADEKFLSLSPQKPSGQALWIFLLTGPFTTILPGVVVAGEAAISERLGWPLRSTKRKMNELHFQKLVFCDRGLQIIYIKNAINYNKPASPNVVRSWKTAWENVPECRLKEDIYLDLLEKLPKAFGEAFNEIARRPSGKPSGKPSRKPSGKPSLNQEAGSRKQETGNRKQEEQTLVDLSIDGDLLKETGLQKKNSEGVGAKIQDTKTTTSVAVQTVWGAYREFHPSCAGIIKSTRKEYRLILARMKDGFSVPDLIKAIHGYHRSPFHNGMNDSGKKYLGLELMVRDSPHVEAGIEMADDPDVERRAAMGSKGLKSAYAGESWLAKQLEKENSDARD